MACEEQTPNMEIEVLQDQVSVSDSIEFVCGRDKIKDTDGNEYKTAYFDIDGGHDMNKEGQCWMAENLNVGTTILNPKDEPSDDGVVEKWCLDKEKEKCEGLNSKEKLGGLYTWGEASNYADLKTPKGEVQGICPEGWHIPEYDDWLYLKNFFSQFDAGTINGVPNRLIVKNNYEGFELGMSRALHRTPDYYVEGITSKLYLTGVMRNINGVIPAIFYIGDEYRDFVLRELEAASQSIRCAQDGNNNKRRFIDGNLNQAEELEKRAFKIGNYISQKTYARNEEILSYFRDKSLLYSLYGFEHHLKKNQPLFQLDNYNSGFLDDDTYIVTLRKQDYQDLFHDFNVGHKYFFIFKQQENEWQLVDIQSTNRGSYVGYMYIGDLQYKERKFPFLKNIFHFENLLRKTESVIRSEKELIEFLKKKGKQ